MFVEEYPPKITSHWTVVIQLQVPSLTCLGDQIWNGWELARKLKMALCCPSEVPTSETMENSQGLTGSASFPLCLPLFYVKGRQLHFFPKLAGLALVGSQPLQAFQRCTAWCQILLWNWMSAG